MRRGLISLTGLFLVLLSMPVRVQGQTGSEAGRVPNRYLFVVETSRTMQRRAEGVVAAAQDLVNSGFRGQLRQGDTLGVWTFNAELATGQFPLEEWSPAAQPTIAIHLLTFLQGQTYEKQARLDKLWLSLERVLKDSQFITVILISSGDDKLQGTPFDAQINDAWSKWRTQQQQARMPLVTILRASHGQILRWSVTPAPWDPDLPPWTPEVQIAQSRPTAPPPVHPAQAANSTLVAPTPKRVAVPPTDSAFSEIVVANPAPKLLPSTNTLMTGAPPSLNAVPPATAPSRPAQSKVPAITTEVKPTESTGAPSTSPAVQGQTPLPEPAPSNLLSKPVTPLTAATHAAETVAPKTEPHTALTPSQENSGVVPTGLSSSVAAGGSIPSEGRHPSAPLTPPPSSHGAEMENHQPIVQPTEVQVAKDQAVKMVHQLNVSTPPGNSHPEAPAPVTAQAPTVSSRSATNQPTTAGTPASRAENSTKSEAAQAAAPQSQAATAEAPAKSDSQVGVPAFPAASTGQTRGAFDVVTENVIWLGLVVVTSALAGFCFFRWLQGFLGRPTAAAEASLSEEQREGDAEQPGTEADQPGKLLAGRGTPAESHAPERAPSQLVKK